MMRLLLLALLLMPIHAGSSIETPATVQWTIPALPEPNANLITGFDVSVQCNAREPSVYSTAGLVSFLIIPRAQVGACNYKVRSTGVGALSPWSEIKTETVTVPPVTGADVF